MVADGLNRQRSKYVGAILVVVMHRDSVVPPRQHRVASRTTKKHEVALEVVVYRKMVHGHVAGVTLAKPERRVPGLMQLVRDPRPP